MRIHKTEPVLTAGIVAGALVAIGSIFHVVIDLNTATTIVAAALPIIGAIWARARVTPIA